MDVLRGRRGGIPDTRFADKATERRGGSLRLVSCRTVTGWTQPGPEDPVDGRYEDEDSVDVG